MRERGIENSTGKRLYGMKKIYGKADIIVNIIGLFLVFFGMVNISP